MLSLATAIVEQLNNYETILFSTVELEFPTGTIRLTDNPYDIVVSGNTFSADGGLLGYSLPRADSIVTRDLFYLELADNDRLFKGRLNANPTGVPLTLTVHVVNPSTNVDIGSFVAYSGRSTTSTIRSDNGTLTVRVEFAGQLFKLDRTNIRLTSPTSQKNVTPTDTAFDFVSAEIGELILNWGRE